MRVTARKAMLLSAASAPLPFLALLALYRPRWETNDDPLMVLMTSGRALVDRPTELVHMIPIPLPLLLKSLYGAFPRFPWYPSSFFLLMGIAVAATLYSLLRLRESEGGLSPLLAAVCLFAGLGGYQILAMQFTKVAFLLGLAGGVASLRYVLERPGEAPAGKWLTLALWTLSVLVRYQAFVLSLLLTATGWLALALVGKALSFRRAAAISIAGGAIAAACVAGDALYYLSRPGWAEFFAWDHVRLRFDDLYHVSLADAKPVLGRIGWSENDFALLHNFFYIDRSVFNLDTLTALLRRGHSLSSAARLKGGVSAFVYTSLKYRALGFLALFWIFLTPANRRRLLLVSVACAAGCVALFYLAKAPDRVASQFWLFPAVFAIALLCLQTPSDRPRHWNFLGNVAVVLLALGQIGWIRPTQKEWNARQDEYLSDVRGLEKRPGRIYVLWGGSMNLELMKPFSRLDEYEGLSFILLGSFVRHPAFVSRVRLLGDHGPPLNLLRDERFYLIAREPQLALLQTLFKERAGRDVGYRVALRGRTFDTYRLEELSAGRALP